MVILLAGVLACATPADVLTTTTATIAVPPSSSTTTTLPTITTTAFPLGPCSWTPPAEELTFSSAGRLYSVPPEGGSIQCLVEGVTGAVSWGPAADRVIVGDTAYLPDGETLVVPRGAIWTHPTGKRIVTIEEGRLYKQEGDTRTEISFLAHHDSVAYHPAGTHVLVVGNTGDGSPGLWLATNEGQGAVLIAADEGAVLSSPAFTGAGESLFTASHADGLRHLHRVQPGGGGALEAVVLAESAADLGGVVASAFNQSLVAYVEGSGGECKPDSRARVVEFELPDELAGLTSMPLGWLTLERLGILAFPDGCQAPADLWIFSAGMCPGAPYGATRLVTGVDSAGVRVVFPPPPPPPSADIIENTAPA
jgi:hypothetical protein